MTKQPLRRAERHFDVPAKLFVRPLKVAVIYAVCYRFRVPIFERLARHPALRTRFFFGKGVPGTKVSNASEISGIDHQVLWSLAFQVRSTGRSVVAQWSPMLLFHLLTYRPDVLLIQGGELFNNLSVFFYARLTNTPIAWWSLGEVRGRQYKGLSLYYRRAVRWIESRSATWLGY